MSLRNQCLMGVILGLESFNLGFEMRNFAGELDLFRKEGAVTGRSSVQG